MGGAAKKVVQIKAKAKFLELRRILLVAKNLKHKVKKFRKVEINKKRAVKASRKARKYLRKVLKGKNKTLIKVAKAAVKKAKRAVKKLVKVSIKVVKHDIKSLHKQGKKIGLKVHIKMNCKCTPKVRSLAAAKAHAKKQTPAKKHG